jgi:hypothetical protein
MNYTKPKIVLSGAAQSVIQGGKTLSANFDAIESKPDHPVYNLTQMAYQADE